MTTNIFQAASIGTEAAAISTEV